MIPPSQGMPVAPPVPVSAAMPPGTVAAPSLPLSFEVNPYAVMAGMTLTGVTTTAVFPWTLPPGCSCTYTWMFNGDKAMDPPVRQASLSCRVHFPPEPAEPCPTCGRS